MRPEDTEMASGEVADEELADMTLEELLSDLPENHPITKAVRTLELEAANLRVHLSVSERDLAYAVKEVVDLRERLAKAREDAIEECAKVCDEWRRTETLETCCDGAQHNALASCAGTIRALKQKGADHE